MNGDMNVDTSFSICILFLGLTKSDQVQVFELFMPYFIYAGIQKKRMKVR